MQNAIRIKLVFNILNQRIPKWAHAPPGAFTIKWAIGGAKSSFDASPAVALLGFCYKCAKKSSLSLDIFPEHFESKDQKKRKRSSTRYRVTFIDFQLIDFFW